MMLRKFFRHKLIGLIIGITLSVAANGLCETPQETIGEIQEEAEIMGVPSKLIEKGKSIFEETFDEEKLEKKKPAAAIPRTPGYKAALPPGIKKDIPPEETDLGRKSPMPSHELLRTPFIKFITSLNELDDNFSMPIPYGYRFFSSAAPPPTPFVALVPDSYRLTHGDQLNIFLWGKNDASYRLTIQEDGTILFPKIGPILLGGLTYGEAKKMLEKLITEKMYGVQVHATINQLRTVTVTLIGEIKRPGLLQVPPMTSLTAALILAGGPLSSGSLRNIQIRRQNGEKIMFDFYRFLDGKSEDLILRSGDLIRIPLIGDQAAVLGQAKRPGTYELRHERTLGKILALAGGIIPQADRQRIQVQRIKDHRYHQVLDIDLSEMSQNLSFAIEDWDIIVIHSVAPGVSNAVYLEGHVRKPGTYQWYPGMRVADLLKESNIFKNDVFLEYALIKRRLPPDREEHLVQFQPGNALADRESKENVLLKSGDRVYIFPRKAVEPVPQIKISGEVGKPGTIRWIKQMTVKDAILLAGGLTTNAYPDEAELLRHNRSGKWERLHLNVGKALKGDPENDIPLIPSDQIIIHPLDEIEPQRKVKIRGAVFHPGDYLLTEGMCVADLVFAAGGLTAGAYTEKTELIRKQVVKGRVTRATSRHIDVKLALAGDDTYNVLLKPQDELYVRPITGYIKTEQVKISGEVKYPGEYAFEPGERLSSIIKRAGGFTERAYLKGAIFQRESVKKRNEVIVKDLVSRLEMDVVRSETSPSMLSEKNERFVASLALKHRALDRLREFQIPGRMIIELKPLPGFSGSQFDIVLEDGDSLHIPPRPDTVSIVGQVYNAAAVLWEHDRTFEEYLLMTGGPTESADEGTMYVVKANGMVVTNKQGLMNHLHHQTLSPGDTIVVPEKIDKAYIAEVTDITQIIYQLAVSVAALAFIF